MRASQHFNPLQIQIGELRGEYRLGHSIDVDDDGAIIRADRLRQRPNAAELEVREPPVVKACQGQSGRLPEETERVVHAARFEGIPTQHSQCEWHILRRFLALTRRHDDHLQTGGFIGFGRSVRVLREGIELNRENQSGYRSSGKGMVAHGSLNATLQRFKLARECLSQGRQTGEKPLSIGRNQGPARRTTLGGQPVCRRKAAEKDRTHP